MSKPNVQEKREAEIDAKKFEKQRTEFRHCLHRIESCPEKWKDPKFGFLRSFCETVETHRDKFPRLMGDRPADIVDQSSTDDNLKLTKGFVASVADRTCRNDIDMEPPVVQVVSKNICRKKGYGSKDPSYKCVELRLTDGDGDQMAARLNTNVADCGRWIDKGDMLRLDIFTPVGFRVNDTSSPLPLVCIAKFSRLGYCNLPADRNEPMEMAGELKKSADDGAEFDAGLPMPGEMICDENSKLCSLYGVEFKICICNCMPPADVDIEEIAEDCHFATIPYSKMENRHKRFLLYWYYATNIYSIRGSGNRKYLPDCLVAAVRELYPSADGKYTGFLTIGKEKVAGEYVENDTSVAATSKSSSNSKSGSKRKIDDR